VDPNVEALRRLVERLPRAFAVGDRPYCVTLDTAPE